MYNNMKIHKNAYSNNAYCIKYSTYKLFYRSMGKATAPIAHLLVSIPSSTKKGHTAQNKNTT